LCFLIAGTYATAQVSWAIGWQKTFGGCNNDGANSIKKTLDGGYIIARWF
jgi:hypothetical protein